MPRNEDRWLLWQTIAFEIMYPRPRVYSLEDIAKRLDRSVASIRARSRNWPTPRFKLECPDAMSDEELRQLAYKHLVLYGLEPVVASQIVDSRFLPSKKRARHRLAQTLILYGWQVDAARRTMGVGSATFYERTAAYSAPPYLPTLKIGKDQSEARRSALKVILTAAMSPSYGKATGKSPGKTQELIQTAKAVEWFYRSMRFEEVEGQIERAQRIPEWNELLRLMFVLKGREIEHFETGTRRSILKGIRDHVSERYCIDFTMR